LLYTRIKGGFVGSEKTIEIKFQKWFNNTLKPYDLGEISELAFKAGYNLAKEELLTPIQGVSDSVDLRFKAYEDKIKEEKEKYDKLVSSFNDRCRVIEMQLEDKEKLKKGLEFYANTENWHTWQHDGLRVLIDGEDAEEIKINDVEGFDCGGKLARQILKEIE